MRVKNGGFSSKFRTQKGGGHWKARETKKKEAQWPIGYGVGLRIKRSSVRIRPWSLRWVLGQGSLLELSQGEAFTLASVSYLAILVKYILAKKKKKKKRNMKCIVHAMKWMQSVSSTESSFSVQTSGVTGRLLFSESSPNLTFPSHIKTVSLLVARTEGNGELPVSGGDWKVDCRQCVSSYVFGGQVPLKPVHCVSKWDLSMDYEGQWQKVGTSKAVAGLPPPKLIKKPSALLDSCVFSVQLVCGLAGVWNFRFGDIPQAQVFFSRGPGRPWRCQPHLCWAWTLWAPKIQLSCQWRSDPRPLRQSRYWRTA